MKNKKVNSSIPLWAAGLIIAIVFLGAAGFISAAGSNQGAGVFSSMWQSVFGGSSQGLRSVEVALSECGNRAISDYLQCRTQHQGDSQGLRDCNVKLSLAIGRCTDLTPRETECKNKADTVRGQCLAAGGFFNDCDAKHGLTYYDCMTKKTPTKLITNPTNL
jgi:hypothetical protein